MKTIDKLKRRLLKLVENAWETGTRTSDVYFYTSYKEKAEKELDKILKKVD